MWRLIGDPVDPPQAMPSRSPSKAHRQATPHERLERLGILSKGIARGTAPWGERPLVVSVCRRSSWGGPWGGAGGDERSDQADGARRRRIESSSGVAILFTPCLGISTDAVCLEDPKERHQPY